MPKRKKVKIVKEDLFIRGYKESGNPSLPLIRQLGDSSISLAIHQVLGKSTWNFAVLLPGGGVLNFVAHTLKELDTFTAMIHSYEQVGDKDWNKEISSTLN